MNIKTNNHSMIKSILARLYEIDDMDIPECTYTETIKYHNIRTKYFVSLILKLKSVMKTNPELYERIKKYKYTYNDRHNFYVATIYELLRETITKNNIMSEVNISFDTNDINIKMPNIIPTILNNND